MKKISLLSMAAFFVLGFFLSPAAVMAEEAENPAKHPAGRRFDKADRNHDGVVDEAERAKAEEVKARWSELKAKADANQDGVVDKVERKEAKKEFIEEKREKFKEFADKNDDGKVGPRERAIAKEKFERRHDRDNNPPGPRGGKGTNWENPPGPKGGKGASPDRKSKGKRY